MKGSTKGLLTSNTKSSVDKRVIGISKRREQTIQRLRQRENVQANDLSLFFDVSTITIRNDLASLEKQGIAVHAYSGALICGSNAPVVEPSVEDKSSFNTVVERNIARAVAELIQSGHRVVLNSGTTAYEIVRLMRQHTNVIAITNGMNVANALLEAEGVELLMTGGHLRRQSQPFYGNQAEQSLQNCHFDILFLGVDAIDLERGVSTHNEDEARLNRRMYEVAKRVVVVTDPTKFNHSSLHRIIDAQRTHTIIIDEGVPEKSLQELCRNGVEVITVGQSRSKIQKCDPIRLNKNKP